MVRRRRLLLLLLFLFLRRDASERERVKRVKSNGDPWNDDDKNDKNDG